MVRPRLGHAGAHRNTHTGEVKNAEFNLRRDWANTFESGQTFESLQKAYFWTHEKVLKVTFSYPRRFVLRVMELFLNCIPGKNFSLELQYVTGD
jgi:hypothetical protein